MSVTRIPKYGHSAKNSKGGRFAVVRTDNGDGTYFRTMKLPYVGENLLKPVFANGVLLDVINFNDVRQLADKG